MPKQRILFVDDEIKVLAGVRRMLRSMHREWDMTFVDGAHKALRHMEDYPVDIIVTDLQMPEMDGVTLLEEVRKRHPQVMRIILSGLGDETLIFQSTCVTHQYFAKPCDAAVLQATIQRSYATQELLADPDLRAMVMEINALPALPGLYDRVLTALNSPNASTRVVGELMSRDISMMTKLLQLVSSSFFGPPRRLTSAVDAVSFLGLDTLRGLMLGIGAFAPYGEKHISGERWESLYTHSGQVTTLVGRIAKELGLSQETVDEAQLIGMLHDVGLLILAAHRQSEVLDAMRISAREHIPMHEAEQRVFGVSHAEVGAFLLGLWGAPDDIVQAVAYHHRPSDCHHDSPNALTAIYLADRLAHGWFTDQVSRRNTIDEAYLARFGLEDIVDRLSDTVCVA